MLEEIGAHKSFSDQEQILLSTIHDFLIRKDRWPPNSSTVEPNHKSCTGGRYNPFLRQASLFIRRENINFIG
jgi:hypothetical protein